MAEGRARHGHPARARAWLAASIMLVGTLSWASACGTNQPGGDGRKVFRYGARVSSAKSLDPVKQFDAASAELIQNVYDSLLEYHYLKRPYELTPTLLRKMPELSADGLTYSFELRDDVRFIDDPCFPGGKGRPLVSDDVIYSFKRFADANTNDQSYVLWQGVVVGMDEFREQTRKLGKGGVRYDRLEIAGVHKLDAQRFTVRLNQPNPLALLPLASSQLAIHPREAVEHYKEEFERHPVGTGPFKMKVYSRRGVVILVKNPDYFGVYPSEGAPGDAEKGLLASAGKRLPLVDEVQMPLLEETQPAILQFLVGQLEWVAMDRDNFLKMAYRDHGGFHLKGDFARKFTIYSEPYLSMEYFFFNMDDPLVGKNRALREAIAYGLDNAGFIAEMRNGRGAVLRSPVPLPIAGSQNDVVTDWFDYDLEAAKRKLVEAGYPGGKGLPPITIEYRSSNSMVRQEFEYRRANLAKIGIKMLPNFQTFSAFLDRVDRGNFQMMSGGWQADYPDAENFLYPLLH
ncbi:MAG TPA: ABC transporter substrate-binding protein, partial [Polyangiales bacterium]|nr:ABC transporter substrate-binding protein [Polyangiales bacterium]